MKVLIDKVPQSKGFSKIGNGTTFCLFWNSNKTESNEYGTNFKGNAFQLRATQFDHLMWTSILFLLVFIDGVKPNLATKLCGTSDYQLLRSEGIKFILWTWYRSNQVLDLTKWPIPFSEPGLCKIGDIRQYVTQSSLTNKSIKSNINYLISQNLKNQIMTTNLWVEQFWRDYKLQVSNWITRKFVKYFWKFNLCWLSTFKDIPQKLLLSGTLMSTEVWICCTCPLTIFGVRT